MSANPVTWFEIYVKDAQRAKAFYENTLTVKLEKLDTPAAEVAEMWSFPMGKDSKDTYGATGALVKMKDGPSGGPGGTVVYFECKDCSVEAGRIRANGGKIMKDKFAIGPHGFIALGTDTEGNMIGLHSMH
jgi:predicted enzyme related to lactoylglutathione lyase